jgi:hypothetical protein
MDDLDLDGFEPRRGGLRLRPACGIQGHARSLPDPAILFNIK